MVITFISDTHNKHRELEGKLPGGDIIIHSGDIMNSGYSWREIDDFCEWFSGLDQYKHKIFIAGNHDRLFEDQSIDVTRRVRDYPNISYLEDSLMGIGEISIWGSPWQPEFCGWAFNLPRRGQDLMRVWNSIPKGIDILVTHGPPQGHLDISGSPYNEGDLGCELLRVKVDEQPPKIHVFGHIHGSHGYKFHNGTHFINASVLDERYKQVNSPLTIEWDPENNSIEFI